MVAPRSIFIKYSGAEAGLLRAAGEIVGHELKREAVDTSAVHRGRAFDVEFSLVGEHGLVDDLGIEFTKYEYQLKLTAFEVGLRVASFAEMYENMSLFIAERLCASLRCEAVVVENLQRLVATFRP